MPNQEQNQSIKQREVIDDRKLKKLLADSKPGFYDKNKHQIITLTLIVISVVVYIVEMVLSGFSLTISTQVLFDMGAMYAPAIHSPFELYRFVTPMFLHLDLMHIAFNMLALYSVGGLLESVLGKRNFLLLYFIGGITGNFVSYVYDSSFAEVASISAGASTSVFGLFVAVALLALLHKQNRNYFMHFSKGMLGIIAVNLAYTFLVPGISVSGHLGGALGGALAMCMIPSKNLRVPALLRILVALLWLGTITYVFLNQGLIP